MIQVFPELGMQELLDELPCRWLFGPTNYLGSRCTLLFRYHEPS